MEEEKKIEIRDMRKKEKFVVDDAYLNGYARKCGVYASAVYMSLCRHANKGQECWPSIKKLAEEHSMSEMQVRRSVKILVSYNIIKVERLGKKLNNRYYLLDKSEWSDRTLTDSTHRTLTPNSQNTHPLTDRTLHSKETHIKETHSKDSNAGVAPRKDQEVFDVIEAFKEINPSYWKFFKNTTQRVAAARLIKQHGSEKILQIIAALEQTNAMQYAPIITTPCQLEDNMGRLMAFMGRLKSNQPNVAKIR